MTLNERLKNIYKEFENDLYPNFPLKNLLIEVTNSCNLNCIFCANNKSTRKRGMIDENLVKRILVEAYNLGTREVGFYTTGEPLLNKNVYDYIRFAKELGYTYTYITTNGILLNDKNIEKLFKSGIDSIKVSINAKNREDYKMIHGYDLYDIVFENLKKLYNYRETNNIDCKIYVSYIATKYTNEDKKEIVNNFKDYCDEVSINNTRNQSGLVPDITDYLICEDETDMIQGKRNVPCHYVFNTINVSYEGYVSACCTDFQNYLAYADLNKVSLEEAWHNQVITNLRRKHLNNDLEGTLCYNCIYNSRELPLPLVEELSTKFDEEIFKDEEKIKRIGVRKWN